MVTMSEPSGAIAPGAPGFASAGAASADTASPGGVRSLVSRRHVVMAGLFAGVSAAGYALTPRGMLPRLRPGTVEAWVPDRIGPWTFASSSGVVLPPPDALSDRLYDNLVTRAYSAQGLPPVMLLIAYSAAQDGMLQVHRPEFCYTASGYRLTPTRDVAVLDAAGRRFGANAFDARGAASSERVLYWTRIDNAFPQSWLEQRAAVMRANLDGRIPDGLLARVSTPSDDRPGSLDSLRAFVTELDRASPPALRALLFGAPRRAAA